MPFWFRCEHKSTQASFKSINTSVAGFWQEHLDKELFWHFWPKPFIAFWHQKERPLLPIYWKRDVHVTEKHPLSKFTGPQDTCWCTGLDWNKDSLCIKMESNLYDIWISHSNSCHNVLLKFSNCLNTSLKKNQDYKVEEKCLTLSTLLNALSTECL